MVKHISERVAVMYVGRIVETAPTSVLFAAPRHPYTEALLAAVPKPDPRLKGARMLLEGEVADPAARVLFPSPLPLRGRCLPHRHATTGRDRAGALRQLPPRRRTDAERGPAGVIRPILTHWEI